MNKQQWRTPGVPCTICGVGGCDCGCPTCTKAEAEREAGTRTRGGDLAVALAAAMKQGPKP